MIQIIALFFAASAAIAAPVRVVISDGPMDVSDPRFSSYFQKETLSTPFGATSSTIGEVNQIRLRKLFEAANPKHYYSQLTLMEVAFVIGGHALPRQFSQLGSIRRDMNDYWTKPLLGLEALRRLRNKGNQAYLNELNQITEGFHGTQILSLVVEGLAPTDIEVIPVGVPATGPGPSNDIRLFHLFTKKWADNFSRILKTHEVRVVNFSWVLTGNNHLKSKIREQLATIVGANPDTIFVTVVDNQPVRVTPEMLALPKLPNVLFVNAVDLLGRPARNSAYSDEFVNLAAWGERVPAALVGGGYMQVAGTSAAAALVTNRLAFIFSKDPSLSAEKALEILYTDHTVKLDSLTSFVNEGRTLKLPVTHLNSLFAKYRATPTLENVCTRALRYFGRLK